MKIIVTGATGQYGAKAPRPVNSHMSKDKLTENGFTRLPTWENTLPKYMKEIQ